MPGSRESARRRRFPAPGASWLRTLPGLGILLLPFAVAAQAPDETPPPSAADGEGGAETAEARPVEHSSPWAAWDAAAWDQALRGFADRQTERPDDPELSLNVGAAHYRLNDFEKADAEFYRAAATGDDELRAQALYNLGNSAYRQGKLGEAVDFYMASLEADPDDLDAKFNLEFVREEMERREERSRDERNRQQDGQQQDGQQRDEQRRDGQQQEEREDQGARPQPGEDRNPDEQPSGQEQDPGDQGPDEPPRDGETPRDGDGAPDAEATASREDGPESGDQGRPGPARPGMTPEEAERYLQALEEGRPDPARRERRGQRGRLAKDW